MARIQGQALGYIQKTSVAECAEMPPRSLDVENHASYLQANIQALDDALHDLRNSLNPVLGPEADETKGNSIMPAAKTPVGNHLQNMSNRVEYLTGMVREIMDRL